MATDDEGEVIVIDGPLPPIEEIIRDHNPYGRGMEPDERASDAVFPPLRPIDRAYQREAALELAGLAREFNALNPLFYCPLHSLTAEEQDRLIYWEFGGRRRAVVKGLRIPYQVTAPDGSVIRSHLLVGYEVPEDD